MKVLSDLRKAADVEVSESLDATRPGFEFTKDAAINLVARPAAGFLGFMSLPAQGAMRAGRKMTSKAIDPIDILREPRLAIAREAGGIASDETRQTILLKFDEIKDDVKIRRRRRTELRWLLKKNKMEREVERQSRDPSYV